MLIEWRKNKFFRSKSTLHTYFMYVCMYNTYVSFTYRVIRHLTDKGMIHTCTSTYNIFSEDTDFMNPLDSKTRGLEAYTSKKKKKQPPYVHVTYIHTYTNPIIQGGKKKLNGIFSWYHTYTRKGRDGYEPPGGGK